MHSKSSTPSILSTPPTPSTPSTPSAPGCRMTFNEFEAMVREELEVEVAELPDAELQVRVVTYFLTYLLTYLLS